MKKKETLTLTIITKEKEKNNRIMVFSQLIYLIVFIIYKSDEEDNINIGNKNHQEKGKDE